MAPTIHRLMYVKASSLQMVDASNRFGRTVLTSLEVVVARVGSVAGKFRWLPSFAGGICLGRPESVSCLDQPESVLAARWTGQDPNQI